MKRDSSIGACVTQGLEITDEINRLLSSDVLVTCPRQCSILGEALEYASSCLAPCKYFLAQDSPAHLSLMHNFVTVLARGRDLLRSCDRANWLESAVFSEEGKENFREVLQDLHFYIELIRRSITNAADEQVSALREISSALSIRMSDLEAEKYDRQHLNGHLRKYLEQHKRPAELARYSWHRLNMMAFDDAPDPLWIEYKQLKFGGPIGSGAYGQVSKATWLGLDCAVKTFQTGDWTFQKEVDALGKLKPHPNIVRMLGYSKNEQGDPCLLMERLQTDLGRHLRQTSQQQQEDDDPLPMPLIVDILLGVAKGMAYLHGQQIFHRDLTPGNILLERVSLPGGGSGAAYWKVKIADFGMSRTRYETAKPSNVTYRVGTIEYMAPEIWGEGGAQLGSGGPKYSKKADVYSFAMLAYHLLHRRPPDVHPDQARRKKQRPHLSDNLHPLWPPLLRAWWHAEPHQRPNFPDIVRDLLAIKDEIMLLAKQGLTNYEENLAISATANSYDALNRAEWATRQCSRWKFGKTVKQFISAFGKGLTKSEENSGISATTESNDASKCAESALRQGSRWNFGMTVKRLFSAFGKGLTKYEENLAISATTESNNALNCAESAPRQGRNFSMTVKQIFSPFGKRLTNLEENSAISATTKSYDALNRAESAPRQGRNLRNFGITVKQFVSPCGKVDKESVPEEQVQLKEQTVDFKVSMHCEHCGSDLEEVVRKMPGVTEAYARFSQKKLTVKGKIDANIVVKNIYEKTGKQATILTNSPPFFELE